MIALQTEQPPENWRLFLFLWTLLLMKNDRLLIWHFIESVWSATISGLMALSWLYVAAPSQDSSNFIKLLIIGWFLGWPLRKKSEKIHFERGRLSVLSPPADWELPSVYSKSEREILLWSDVAVLSFLIASLCVVVLIKKPVTTNAALACAVILSSWGLLLLLHLKSYRSDKKVKLAP